MAIVQWCFGPMSLSWVSVSLCNHLLPASCLLKCWPMRRLLRIELDPCAQTDTQRDNIQIMFKQLLEARLDVSSSSSLASLHAHPFQIFPLVFSLWFLYPLLLTFSNPSFSFLHLSRPYSSFFYSFLLSPSAVRLFACVGVFSAQPTECVSALQISLLAAPSSGE